ncbi:hypothetical protein ACFPH6_46145 [Streptomyces xiangluensis]|uniref:WXG100 family type VII secretion target n=1 Tax=Streptomyces xiangluensis TaxID=2665720 RepID=A0ABV8Z5N3_9ACTN
MSYGYGDRFEADPGKLRSLLEETRALGKDISAAAAAFESDMQSTSMWHGISDDFFKEVDPGERRELESMLQAYWAIVAAFKGITEGHFQELGVIKKAPADAMDKMDDLKRDLNNIGENPGGGAGRR